MRVVFILFARPAAGFKTFVSISLHLITGFLRPGVGDNTVGNFGLLDQVAALQWVKENIEQFGGNPQSVTLMGHGTGAACVNLLLVSPVQQSVEGLFHRAILMSGTALSDWALNSNPMQSTIVVAEALNCPLAENSDEMVNCLRRKRLSEIMAVRNTSRPFQTPFGPVVDGSVVPNEPGQLMGVYNDLFSKYDLMYGLTETESYHHLNSVDLSYGMLEKERDQMLRSYFQAKYEMKPDLALAETLREYTDWRHSLSKNMAEVCRDVLLDILSDARVAAPLVQMADFHSAVNPKSYFYVFTHRSMFGDYSDAKREKSINGEELPYVFGVPVDGSRFHFHQAYNMTEKLFSEAVMTFWTNFAHTGNPNAPRRQNYLTQGPREWRQYDVDWPEYDATNKTYLNLGIPPKIDHHYRRKMMGFWNDVLPKLLKNPADSTLRPTELEPAYEYPEVPTQWSPGYPNKPHHGSLPEFTPKPHGNNGKYENFNKPYLPRNLDKPRPTKFTFGTIVTNENENPKTLSAGSINEISQSQHPNEGSGTPQTQQRGSSSWALGIVIVIGVVFLVINLSACAALYYQRDRLKAQEEIMKRKMEDTDVTDEEEYGKRRRVDSVEGENKSKTILKKEKKASGDEEIYEAVRSGGKTIEAGGESALKKWRLSRQCSTSTMDPHTKVREWIAHEIVQRCSPRFLRRTRLQMQKQSTDTSIDQNPYGEMTPVVMENFAKDQPTSSPTTSKPSTSVTQQRSKVKKISVAVDATPAARSASVLKQMPIELMSKSLGELDTKSISTSMLTLSKKPSLKRCATAGEDLAVASVSSVTASLSPREVLRRSTSVSFHLYTPPPQFQNHDNVRIEHSHSRSDPVSNVMPCVSPKGTNNQKLGGSQTLNRHLVDISLDPKDQYYKPIQMAQTIHGQKFPIKHGTLKYNRDIEATANPADILPKDINVTSRDSNEDKDVSPLMDPLTHIQRRNFPKVLPDFPRGQETDVHIEREMTPVQAVASKRRSLPHTGNLHIGLLPPLNESGSYSQPTTPTSCYHKDIQTQTYLGKIPPPPPPRVSSTLGKKPTNDAQISPLIIATTPHKTRPIIAHPTPTNVNLGVFHQTRQEPKVIIRPTLVKPSTKMQAMNQKIPRVTAKRQEDYSVTPSQASPSSSPHPLEGVLSSTEKRINQGLPPSVVPVPTPRVPVALHSSDVTDESVPPSGKSSSCKKSSGTSTDDSSSNTGTVKRVKKTNERKPKTSENEVKPISKTSNAVPKKWYAQYSQSFISKSKDEG
uniref:Carboxylesterase type B domain-containing protein n=1 Tax=Timema bartmani TaxID=61472 RepID=A0A7R9F2P7_9NEOP|nr:unnamed protein product [Timema bartmani]